MSQKLVFRLTRPSDPEHRGGYRDLRQIDILTEALLVWSTNRNLDRTSYNYIVTESDSICISGLGRFGRIY